MKLILTETQHKMIKILFESEQASLTPQMQTFHSFYERAIPKLNALYSRISFLSVGDLLGNNDAYRDLTEVGELAEGIGYKASELHRSATKPFDGNYMTDEEYEAKWENIHNKLDDLNYDIYHKSDAIDDIVSTLKKLAEGHDLVKHFNDVKPLEV
tara:strand:+ start:5965 stop:6432 length:468 start_codon:yes stop_codon:yes gene_type:complete